MKYGGTMNIKMKISEIDQPLSISLILWLFIPLRQIDNLSANFRIERNRKNIRNK